jgi:hypothetical protein
MDKKSIQFIYRIVLAASLGICPMALAADGSGVGSVVPSAIAAGSGNNALTFTYTATEDLGDGAVRMTVPAGFPDPQGSAAASPGYTTVAIVDGVSATVIDPLDAVPTGTPGWNANDGVPLLDLVNIGLDTDEFYEGAGSLEMNLLAGTGLTPALWYNYGTAQDWTGYTHLSFRLKASTLLTAIADIFNNTELKICSDHDLHGVCERHQLSTAIVDIALLTGSEWVQVIVALDDDAANRASVQSYGFDLPLVTVETASSLNFDDVIAGPGDTIFSGDTVTQPLLFLNAGGTVTFTYRNVTAPAAEGSFTFLIASSTGAAGIPTGIATPPVVTVLDLENHSVICEDVDADSKEECSVDVDNPPNGCGDVYVDPDGSSCSVVTADANAATDGNPQDCVDYFIDIGCDGNGCPEVFWDPTNGILTPVTSKTLDVDGDGTAEAVCAFDSDGDGDDDSFELAGGEDNGGGGGGGGDGTEIGGAGAGGPNPFSVQGGGCSLIR